ncbi:hypothetical protein ACRZPB_004731, partial [Vibrio parahaemolyticus]
TGFTSKAKSFGFYWLILLALHLIKCAFQVRSGGTRCEVLALSVSFTVSNFGLFLWRGFFGAEKFRAKQAFLCRSCSSSKPVSFANLKAMKKGS